MTYEWRSDFTNEEVNALHAEGFRTEGLGVDWWARLQNHSLGWVCARGRGELVGFVNVAWDGGFHAFLLDTVVAAGFRRRGIGTALIAMVAAQSAEDGCEWLHVDFEDHLATFYCEAAGFSPTSAGLMRLRE